MALAGTRRRGKIGPLGEPAVIDPGLKGRAALEALEQEGRLFAVPAEVAAVLERDLKSVRLGLHRNQIPHVRVGPRYQVLVAWLRRTANGLAA
jgi:hypothetical protein